MILWSVYCLGTDGVNTLVTGTARHGRVRSVVFLVSIAIYINKLIYDDKRSVAERNFYRRFLSGPALSIRCLRYPNFYICSKIVPGLFGYVTSTVTYCFFHTQS